MKHRRQIGSMAKIRDIIERQTSHSFTEMTLGEVLRVLPKDTIVTEWQENNRKNHSHQLYLSLKSSEDFDSLMASARQYLTNLVKDAHSSFLKSLGEGPVPNLRQWHARFNLNSVAPIVPISLNRPVIKQQMTIAEALYVELPPRSSLTVLPPKKDSIILLGPKPPPNISSYFTIAKSSEDKEIVKEQLLAVANRKHTDEMLRMADLMNTMFTGKNKESLRLTEILDGARRTEYFRGLDIRRIGRIVDGLIEKSDGYFRKTELRGYMYVHVEPSAKRTYQMARGPILRAILGEGDTQDQSDTAPMSSPIVPWET
jgi:hypothetical protein